MRAPRSHTGAWIAFVDLLANVVMLLMVVSLLQSLQPHLKAKEDAKAGVSPGKMCVELSWPDTTMADIDLWGRAPGSADVVFYKHRSSADMDLLRDDLGMPGDVGDHHLEMICSHVLRAGEWTFNAVYYGHHASEPPRDIPVDVTVTWSAVDSGGFSRSPIRMHATMRDVGDEETLIDLTLDDYGNVVPDSVNDVPTTLMGR